ncbi:M24 family metallopeptidase [Natrinema caseinilyticum]|uniref:M24 family metallopeptidase n=1 Tax=Natrinema caseinilyticum TaxID=2961570 RepID=UPI0020C22B86|nr:M24 family metallopeptidase [Natrinema caseinilyticum]
MTGRSDRRTQDGNHTLAAGGVVPQRRDHAVAVISPALEDRDATAFVHVGTDCDPGIRYCTPRSRRGLTAVAYDALDGGWLVRSAADDSGPHPAEQVASVLADRGHDGTVLTPARVPHDAALYLENAGFELASTAALERARAVKTGGEHERIAAAQRAANAGVRRAASLLADAAVIDGRLAVAGDGGVGSEIGPEADTGSETGPAADTGSDRDTDHGSDFEFLTPARLRIAVDEAIVGAGAFPAGNTVVDTSSGVGTDDAALRPGVPIVLETAPRSAAGYHGGLVRTFVVDSDGGRERRVHVAVTQSFRSARSMLTAGSASVSAVAADLEAEVRSFGFGEGDDVATRVSGVGLESREQPLNGDDVLASGSIVRLDVAATVDEDNWLRIADLLAVTDDGERPEWIASPSQSLDPGASLK